MTYLYIYAHKDTNLQGRHLALLATHERLGQYTAAIQNQLKRYKDTLKATLISFDLGHETWEKDAMGRNTLHNKINQDAKLFEKGRLETARKQRGQET